MTVKSHASCRTLPKLSPLGILVITLLQPAVGDEVIFSNGDRLAGGVLPQEGGELLIARIGSY